MHIIVDNNIEKLYRYNTDINSASIYDKEGVIRLFGEIPPEQVIFIDLEQNNVEDVFFHQGLLEQAKEYLKKSHQVKKDSFGKNNHSQLFLKAEQQTEDNMDISELGNGKIATNANNKT